MKTRSFLLPLSGLSLLPALRAQKLSNKPVEEPVIGQLTNQGCFDSDLGLTLENKNLPFNSDGSCTRVCKSKSLPVAATKGGQECWCGKEYPPKDSVVDNSKCDIGCTGFNKIPCGGLDTFSVYNTGVKLAVHFHDGKSEESTSDDDDGDGSRTSDSKDGSETDALDLSGSDSEPDMENGDGGNGSKTIIIVVAVISSLVFVAAASGVAVWLIRRRRNREIEEDHRRNAAVTAFIHGSDPNDGGRGSTSITDSRLDPAMAANHRRSDGSIADSQDYSRKILRVTNA